MMNTLPRLAPNAARGARTVARCHAVLASRQHPVATTRRPAAARPLANDRLWLAGFSAAYLVAVARTVLEVMVRH
jgi:hypothetical protein